MSGGGSSFGKTICSICYEDINPIVEDLQVISICGHVFHELCLQQWLEYCPAGKKISCPICKQFCAQKDICRLYFQSVGEQATQSMISSVKSSDVDAEGLRQEVRKLEMKVSGLTSASEQQQQRLKELNSELAMSKDLVSKEKKQKDEALLEAVRIRKLLQTKTEELNVSSAECSKLHSRCINLAKELATLKLVSDVNLDEEEALKLASMGAGSNKEQIIEILKKSLILRNKSYKELMAQCNLLGRGESRSLMKLEKAEEKIKKLKARLQELERAVEARDNEVLRSMKASKRTSVEQFNENSAKGIADLTPLHRSSLEADKEKPYQSMANPKNHTDFSISGPFNSMAAPSDKDLGGKMNVETKDVIDLDIETDSLDCFVDVEKIPSGTFQQSVPSNVQNTKLFEGDEQKLKVSYSAASILPSDEACFQGKEDPIGRLPPCMGTEVCGRTKSEKLTDEDTLHVSSSSLGSELLLPNIVLKREYLSAVNQETSGDLEHIIPPGYQCVPGGLSSEGAKRYAGKWCRQAQKSETSGDFISVGADGRGGTMKVLKARSQLDGRGSPLSKRCKYGTKDNVQSQGCLQLEHFFVKQER